MILSKNMRKLNLKIDIDGVLRDVYPAMIRCYEREQGLPSKIKPSDITIYDLDKAFPGIGNIWEFFKRNGKEIFRNSNPFSGYKIINELGKEHNVILVTHQLEILEQLTIEWLKECGINHHGIEFTKDKHLIEGDILLDDAPTNILNPEEKSIKVIMDRTYNKELEGHRVKNLKEFHEFVKKLAEE